MEYLTKFIKNKQANNESFLMAICSDSPDFNGLRFDELLGVKLIETIEDYQKLQSTEDYIIVRKIQQFEDKFCFSSHCLDESLDYLADVIIFIIKGNIIVAKDKLDAKYNIISSKIDLKEACYKC